MNIRLNKCGSVRVYNFHGSECQFHEINKASEACLFLFTNAGKSAFCIKRQNTCKLEGRQVFFFFFLSWAGQT